ncbi:hypothetical protein E2C01_082147 [Portunus trituberculatus]|uniref:Uncharacterized protein n=1 Tax=Portunus trituberculatus TaxID=210409 RepID=A0A5B7IYB3_PORTR|nr:hypothetical protein [Portunus trituberculatus]
MSSNGALGTGSPRMEKIHSRDSFSCSGSLLPIIWKAKPSSSSFTVTPTVYLGCHAARHLSAGIQVTVPSSLHDESY